MKLQLSSVYEEGLRAEQGVVDSIIAQLVSQLHLVLIEIVHDSWS